MNGESDEESDGYHVSDDEVIESVTEENCEDADEASAVENCKMLDHCSSAITVV